ncbi:uncharacterized protein LOC117323803 isoform X3 [Pecten maximus]|uniref:uncharacterized protein LOC117323803 isoform X1 n=1 Tax=Pecten maximus TaxID=6579 RepID=UPI0014587EB7|nr:uncharacterized protein LOC117323803 isoform X1 [Pecten maximus]XP_033735151.1 uncharacterized protein LOC117323803 isoform X2 [Pecten maximus]XP_033735152.1 uncharacterized protein LOC117323803 isoform X3 [Pecten maximus]
MPLNRIFTKFFKLDEKRALQAEFHRIGSKPGPQKWLPEDQLSEIEDLLHDIIQKCLNDKGKTEKKSEKSSQIITGNTVKIGCVLKKSQSGDLLLEENSDGESVSRTLYGQKLVVYVCPLEPGSPNCGSELYKAMARNESGSKMVKISSYFSKAGGTGTHGRGQATGATSSTTSSSQDQKDVIKNIMKRGKMSKHSKKKKSSAGKKEQQKDTTQNTHTTDQLKKRTSTDDNIKHSINSCSKFPQTSAYVDIQSDDEDLEMEGSCVSMYRHKSKIDNSREKSNSMATRNTHGTSSFSTKQADNVGEGRHSIASNNTGNACVKSALGTITVCDVSSSSSLDCPPDDEPTITVYSAEQVQELNLLVQPSCPATSVTVDRCEPVMTTSDPSPESGQDDSNDSILPSYSFIQQKPDARSVCEDNSELDNNLDVDSDPLFHQYVDVGVDFDDIRFSDSSCDDNSPSKTSPCRTLEGQDKPPPDNLDSDSADCLIALKRRMSRKRVLPNFPDETKSDEEMPHKRQRCDSDKKSSNRANVTDDPNVQTMTTSISQSADDLPSLMRSRHVRRSPRKFKQATLKLQGGNLAITKKQTSKPRVSRQDEEDFMMMEDEESKRLRSDLRREIIHAESVKDLNEQHVWFLVQENKRYLKDIFEGKIPCERHKQFKQGGKTRYRLNYQVYLSLFTDEQQDVVMEALMAIFCKKDHGFLDYVMKVMLPEILIKIYMEVTGLDHDEVDEIMARGGK